MAQKGHPLLQGYAQGQVIPSVNIHVQKSNLGLKQGECQNYIDALLEALRLKASARENLAKVIDARDRFKVRLFYMANLVPLDRIQSYVAAATPYRRVATLNTAEGARVLPRETYHVFPSEIGALRYESKLNGIPDEPQNRLPRELATDAVVQLERLDRFQLFVNAWACGVIREESTRDPVGGGDQEQFVLELPGDESIGPMAARSRRIELTLPVVGQPSVWQEMNNFNYRHTDSAGNDIDDTRFAELVNRSRDAAIAERVKTGDLGMQASTAERVKQLGAGTQEELKRLFAEYRLLEGRQAEIVSKLRGGRENDLREWDTAGIIWLYLREQLEAIDGRIRRQLS